MTELEPVKQSQPGIFNQQQIELIKKQIAPDCTDDELKLFMNVCQRTKLDPFARQIYAQSRRSKNQKGEWESKLTILISIDGFRLIAERSHEYAGQLGPFWCGEDGVWKDVWLKSTPPRASKVGVLKSTFKEPLWATALYSSYAQMKDEKPTYMWSKMPDIMLAKCAESLALRKAFPNDLSGLYTNEEMAQSENLNKVSSSSSKSIALVHGGRQEEEPSPEPESLFDPPPQSSGGVPNHDYVIPFGKYKGLTLNDVDPEDLLGYATYLVNTASSEGKEMRKDAKDLVKAVKTYLGALGL